MLSRIVSLATLVAVAYYLRRSGVGWTPALMVACCAASSLGLCVASMMGIKNLKDGKPMMEYKYVSTKSTTSS